MNAKYPDAYGTCYVVPKLRRVVGVRKVDFERIWYVGYVDGKPGAKVCLIHPLHKSRRCSPGPAQDVLDGYAESQGWKVAV